MRAGRDLGFTQFGCCRSCVGSLEFHFEVTLVLDIRQFQLLHSAICHFVLTCLRSLSSSHSSVGRYLSCMKLSQYLINVQFEARKSQEAVGICVTHVQWIARTVTVTVVGGVNGIGVIHTCIYVHIYVHSIWLTPASFGSRHDLTLVVRSQTKRQQSAHSVKDQGLHSCYN